MTSRALEIARSIARSRPEAELLCPLCANPMKGASLDAHLARVHTDEPGPEMEWRGADRAASIPALLLMLLSFLVLAAGVRVIPQHSQIVVGASMALLVPGLAVLMASLLDALPATLRVHGDHLECRYLFGLATKRVRLGAAEVESGELRQRVESLGHDHHHVERRMGSYLRVRSGGKALTLAVKKGTAMGKRWDPATWRRGPARRHWDVMVDRRALALVEYELAARGALRLRG